MSDRYDVRQHDKIFKSVPSDFHKKIFFGEFKILGYLYLRDMCI